MDEVMEFLKNAHPYYLATVEGDQPRVRAFGTVCKFEGSLYIQTGRVKDVYKQLKANPKAEIIALDGHTWLRIATTLVEDPRIEAEEAMFAEYPNLLNRYQPGDGNNVVFRLENSVAKFETLSPDPARVIEF